MTQVERERLLEDHLVHALAELGAQQGLAGRKPALHGRKRSHQHAFEHDVTEHGGEIGPARGLVQADRRHDRIDDLRADERNAGG